MHTDPAWIAKGNVKLTQSEYAQAISYLGVCKDAWRNFTMHGRRTYSQEDAKSLFANTENFARRLSKIGLTEIVPNSHGTP